MKTAASLGEIDSLARPLVLVPTMGALHAGHASLIRQGVAIARSRSYAGGCVVTSFVNPTQFNERSDYDRYPRTPDADLELCRQAGAAAVVSPEPSTVYPPGVLVPVPTLPPVATTPGLEDAHRPGHFAGVCQIVKRLFDLCRADAAVFGEKDWQQLQVIRAVAHEAFPNVEIVPARTEREPDGLAMSSRNVFLAPPDRLRARALHRALRTAGTQPDPDAAEAAMHATLRDAGIGPDYAVVREATSLVRSPGSPLERGRSYRALIAARVGPVRLIDNAPWPG